MSVQNDVLQFGRTIYDHGADDPDNCANLGRRILCLMGGPVAQAIYENKDSIDIDNLGMDGIEIDRLLSNCDIQTKGDFIQNSIDAAANFLNVANAITARQSIANKLVMDYIVSKAGFLNIVANCNVEQITW